MNSGVVHITKLGAAERQLKAAIRMFFSEEDELAIHTVASAAYRLLRDLKGDGGVSEVESLYRVGFFYVIRDFRRGTLPEDMTGDPEMMSLIRSLAEELPITSESGIDDFSVKVPLAAARDFWKFRNKTANFLKHADRDATQSISLDDVDNFTLLLFAFTAYTQLSKDELGNEGFVFKLYINATNDRSRDPQSPEEEFAKKLSGVSEYERLRICAELIQEFNGGGESV